MDKTDQQRLPINISLYVLRLLRIPDLCKRGKKALFQKKKQKKKSKQFGHTNFNSNWYISVIHILFLYTCFLFIKYFIHTIILTIATFTINFEWQDRQITS